MNPKPQSTVYVAYVIPNPAETQTFYPQAVVKNTQTGAVVATINLTQDPNNILRYTGSFISPADSTGMGYYLDVITIPYTDQAHTVPSLNYWAATNQYFVSQSISGGANYGGGYMDFDSKKLRKLFQEELTGFKPVVSKSAPIKFPEFPKQEKVDLEPTNAVVSSILAELRSMRSFIETLPTFEHTNLAPLAGSIAGSKKEIVTQFQSSILDLDKTIRSLPETMRAEIKLAVSGILRIFQEQFTDLVEKGIPIRSPVFQETKPRAKSTGISDITKALADTRK